MTEDPSEFQLVFEGPRDTTPDTMRRLKGFFIGDLELSVPEVMEIFSKAPCPIKKSSDQKEIERLNRRLKEAGGNSSIITPPGFEPAASELELQFELGADDLGLVIEEVPQPTATSTAESASHATRDGQAEKPGAHAESSGGPPISDLVLSGDDEVKEEEQVAQEPPAISKDAPMTLAFDLDGDAPVIDKKVIDKKSAEQPEKSAEFDLSFESPNDMLLLESEKQAKVYELPDEADSISALVANAEAQLAAGKDPALDDTDNFLNLLSESLAQEEKPPEPMPTKESAKTSDDLDLKFDDPVEDLTIKPETPPAPIGTPPEKPAVEEQAADGLSLLAMEEPPPEIAAPQKRADPPPEKPAPPAASAAPAPPAQSIALEGEPAAAAATPPPAEEPNKASEPPAEEGPQLPLSNMRLADLKKGRPAEGTLPAGPAPAEGANPGSQSASTGEDEGVPRTPKRSFLRQNDLAVAIVAGAVLLGVVNWFVFSTGETVESNAELSQRIKASVEASAKLQSSGDTPAVKAVPTKAIKPTPVPMPSLTLNGSAQDEELQLIVALSATDKEVLAGTFHITTPQPRELTPEEIVNNKVRAPWITRIDIDAGPFEANSEGAYLWQGPAKTYIEYNGKRVRLLTRAETTVRFNAVSKKFDAEVQVINLDYVAPPPHRVGIEFVEDQEFKIYVKASASGEGVAIEPTPAQGSASAQNSAPEQQSAAAAAAPTVQLPPGVGPGVMPPLPGNPE